MGIRYDEPPIRPFRKSMNYVESLIEENRNLKRLLNIVKRHVIHDEALFKEIKEASKE
jgi:hypothetical protein